MIYRWYLKGGGSRKVSMCHYVSLPTYGKEYCPYCQNSRADTSRDLGYIKPPSATFLQSLLVQLVSALDFWARRIGFSTVLGQKKTKILEL